MKLIKIPSYEDKYIKERRCWETHENANLLITHVNSLKISTRLFNILNKKYFELTGDHANMLGEWLLMNKEQVYTLPFGKKFCFELWDLLKPASLEFGMGLKTLEIYFRRNNKKAGLQNFHSFLWVSPPNPVFL